MTEFNSDQTFRASLVEGRQQIGQHGCWLERRMLDWRGGFTCTGAQGTQGIDDLLTGAATRLKDQEWVFVEALAQQEVHEGT